MSESNFWVGPTKTTEPLADVKEQLEEVFQAAARTQAAEYEAEQLRVALREIREQAAEGCRAPNAAYRWCELIDETAHTALSSDTEENGDR